MKNFYYVVMEEIDGKKCAYVDKVSENTNICGRWEASQFICIQPCESKKRAEEIAEKELCEVKCLCPKLKESGLCSGCEVFLALREYHKEILEEEKAVN